MVVSRRSLLVAGQTLLAAAVLPMKFLGAAAASGFGSNAANLAVLTKEDFLPLVSSSFAVRSDSITRAWFTLLSVEDMNSQTPAPATVTSTTIPPKPGRKTTPQTDTFVLHFLGTGETLGQGTYELENSTLGRFSLFVVPSGATTYAAVISHLLNPGLIATPGPVKPKGQAVVPFQQDQKVFDRSRTKTSPFK